MGWSLGFDSRWQRDIGYSVPALCDHPGCTEEIDRGLSYVCGGDLWGGDAGCGLHFCSTHLAYFIIKDEDTEEIFSPQLCDRCGNNEHPFNPKPDIALWMYFKLTDKSWAEWRNENEKVTRLMQLVIDSLPLTEIESFKKRMDW